MKRLLYLLFFFLTCAPPTIASGEMNDALASGKQLKRQMKNIREQLKEQNADAALKTVQQLCKDSDNLNNPQLLHYAVEACRMLNDKENEKMYLRSNPDTTAFFHTLYNTFDYILRTDSAERAVDDAKTKYKFRKEGQDYILRHYRNLVAAPLYFDAYGRWDETQRFTALAIETAQSPMMTVSRRPVTTPEKLSQLAVRHLNAAFRNTQYGEVERYAPLALEDREKRASTLELLAYAQNEIADTTGYLRYLTQGNKEYPANMFFFSRLVDSFLHQCEYDSVHATANRTLEYVLSLAQEEAEMCQIDMHNGYQQPADYDALTGVRQYVSLPANDIAQIFEARAIAYHNQRNHRACIQEALNILNWNPQHNRADYFIGTSYFSLALGVDLPTLVTDPGYQRATTERNRLLNLGRPHLEKFRALNPDNAEMWGPLLYETYLYLNLGDEFEEISRFIQSPIYPSTQP